MLKLTDRQWSIFSLDGQDGIFMIKTTSSSIDGNKLNKTEGNVPYITRTGSNNGISGFYDEQKGYTKDDGNCITVGLDTQTAFYQPVPFYTGQNIQVLISKHMSDAVAYFFLAPLKKTLSIFNWGSNGATLKRLRRAKIMLPVTSTGKPDYEFMEQYVKEHQKALLDDYIAFAKTQLAAMTYKPVNNLEECEWKEFKIGDVFKVDGTITTRPEELLPGGTTPRITCSSTNNALDDTYQNDATEEGGVLTIDSATVGSVNYQPTDFIATDHVEKVSLDGKYMNKYIGTFLACAIEHATSHKYNYGYKFSQFRIKRQTVLLPTTLAGTPDYEYMEQYVKNIMIIKIQEYLNFVSKSI